MVFVSARMVLSAKGTITGALQILGLPFTAGGAVPVVGSIAWDVFVTSYVSLVGNVSVGTTAVTLLGLTAAGTTNLTTTLGTANIGNTSEVRFSMTYRAAA
jgi:hypothetical protein